MARRGIFRSDDEYPHGVDDVTFDCRCYGERYADMVAPWLAISSQVAWGADPDDLPDGDVDRLTHFSIEEFEGAPIPVEHVDSDFECYCGYCLRQMADEALEEYIPRDERSLAEVLEDLEEADDLLREEITEGSFGVVPFEEDYNLNYEYLPKRISSGIVRTRRDSRMETRQCGEKQGRGTFQCGKRGNSYYKLLRRGRVRVTNRKSERIARMDVQIREVWFRQRVICAR